MEEKPFNQNHQLVNY